MISVEEAVSRIVAGFAVLESERVGIAHAAGRVLAKDASAKFDQPPAPMSAMDGYALRASEAANVPARLCVIGESPAGKPFAGKIGRGQAVRIFTGAVVPEGADTIVIQEDTVRAGDEVTVKKPPRPGQHIRAAGLDFRAGDVVLDKGRRLTARDVGLLAAADFAQVEVVRKPHIALIATGDELSRPGAARAPGGIIASSTYALAAMVEKWGGTATDIGILPDKAEAFASLPEATRGANLIVTQGGASVGDHDLVQRALAPHGFKLDFWKIAMRPGKPLIFGRLNATPLLGLPGNPVSAMVCSILFLRPGIAAMLGMTYQPAMRPARLATPLKANGVRQDYIRTRIISRDGAFWAEPFALQDSSMQKIFAQSDGLIVRAPRAPAARQGDRVDVLLLDAY